MKKLLIFFLLLPVLAFSQRADVLVKTDIFTVHYSEVFQQPLNIEYTVLCPNGTASRKGMDFYTNDSIITSDNADYENNIYDKGHLAPAADFTCSREMLHKTFSYLNCALQDQYLNRGTWRLLESYERQLAVTSPGTKVEIVLEFKVKTKLPTGATVPSGFYKRITSGGKVYMYYFPNSKPTTSDYTKYRISTWPKKVN
jgi:endonuclease G